MIKTAHEAPISIFSKVQEITDIDYALVHLFEESKAYFNLFTTALEKGREVILDNSIFELGVAFDPESYADWIMRLNPTWFIIPDVLEDRAGTVNNLLEWVKKYDALPGKTIGVVQGNTFEETLACYQEIEPYVDMVAISFDYCWYEEVFPTGNKLVSWMLGRQYLIQELELRGIVNTSKPHHLLGCSLPQEFIEYANTDWIYSVDTSNPVVAGMKNKMYKRVGDGYGLDKKPSEKLFTMIHSDVSREQWSNIEYNVNAFYFNLRKSDDQR